MDISFDFAYDSGFDSLLKMEWRKMRQIARGKWKNRNVWWEII
jgi:hypothetical protein